MKQRPGGYSRSVKKGVDVMKVVFSKPYEFEGKTYDNIELNLEGLKGTDISAAKRQFQSLGFRSTAPVFDSDYCALVAARASKQPIEFFNGLPAPEYLEITSVVTSFLARLG